MLYWFEMKEVEMETVRIFCCVLYYFCVFLYNVYVIQLEVKLGICSTEVTVHLI